MKGTSKKFDPHTNIVTTITRKKLGKYEFFCSKCHTVHKMPLYAIAQRAMNHALIFTCECENKIDL